MKVFISTPMRGKSPEEILAYREKQIEAVKNEFPGEPLDVIQSVFPKEFVEAHTPLYCLGESFKILSAADVAVFPASADESRGCKLEKEAAEAYGIRVIVLPELEETEDEECADCLIT